MNGCTSLNLPSNPEPYTSSYPKAFRYYWGLLLLCLTACAGHLYAQDISKASTYLHTGWEYRQLGRTDEWRPTRVPGSVHLDLVKDGIIADPYLGNNEKDLSWIEYASYVHA
jgi:hypothetical protein